MADITVVIPYGGGADRWLDETLASLPAGVPRVVARNDQDLAGALNQAIAEATTDFVFRIDADDLLMPGALEQLQGFTRRADVVYPAMFLASEQLELGGLHEADPFCGWRLQDMNYVTGAALMRRSKVLEVGGYRDMEALEDWDLWLRMFKAGARFKACPAAAIVYRIRDTARNSRVRTDPDFLARLRAEIVGDTDPLAGIAATFYTQATPATTYLRCQLPSRYLPGLVMPHAAATVDTEDNISFPGQHGAAAVFQYPGDKNRALITQAMRAEGIRVLVEADDNYLINPGRTILRDSNWSMKIGDKAHSRQGHRWIVENADGIIVTTARLADEYREFNENVYVCPNTVDPADWPEPEKPADGVFRIGWIASKSHLVDSQLVRRAFEWAARQKDVEVYVAGIDPHWNFPYRLIPWQDDLDGYRELFRLFDVSVAPIRPLPFALYRSDVKALESAMGLACPVLSDVSPYADWRDGENCLKATDARGFYDAIRRLVANREEARELAEAARGYTLAERTTEKQIGHWEEAIAG